MKRALFAILPVLLLTGRSFAAEPSEAEKRAAAEAIFSQASNLMAIQDYATACPKLEEVVQLQPNGIGARATLADCYAAIGRFASAHASYSQAASMATIAGQDDRAASARDKAAALEPKLSKLKIRVSPEVANLKGLTIMRGGLPVSASLFNVAIAVDGGKYTIAAAADGREPFTRVLEILPESAGAEVEIVLARPSRTEEAIANQLPMVELASHPMPPVRIGGIVVGGLGLALAGAGIGVAVSGLGKSSDAAAAFEASESGSQADAARADHDAAGSQIVAGWVLTGVGAAAAVAGVIMIALPTPEPARSKSAFSLRIGPTMGGAMATGTW